MKSLFTALILTLALCGFARQANAQDDQIPKASEYAVTLRAGKQKKVTPDKINIKFVSLVEDSRCPADVQCIQAGNARIKVTVSKAGSEPLTFEVNTNLGVRGNRYDNYAIYLTDLKPVLKSNVRLNRNAYTATFSVTRLSR